MKIAGIAALLLWSFAGAAFAQQVKYEVTLARDGKVVSSPTFVGEVDKPAVFDQPQVMKVEVLTEKADNEGNSPTTVKFQLFEKGKLRPPEESWMLASLASKPATFEYSVPGTNAKFTFKQTQVSVVSKKP